MNDSTSNLSRSLFVHVVVFSSNGNIFLYLDFNFLFIHGAILELPFHSVAFDVYINISLHSACSPQMKTWTSKWTGKIVKGLSRVKLIESDVRRFVDRSHFFVKYYFHTATKALRNEHFDEFTDGFALRL